MPRKKKAPLSANVPDFSLTDDQLHAIDAQIGGRVRSRRLERGFSQESVAKAMELTFQQLQKYEHGTNRISGSRLYQLAMILDVPVAYFFEGVSSGADVVPAMADPGDLPANVMTTRRTAELVRAYYSIDTEKQRDAALALLKTLGKEKSA